MVKLQLWDTCSQERFRTITRTYFQGAHCALIVYDITQAYTLESTTKWIKDVRESAPDNVVIVMCGNKCDLKDDAEVSEAQGIEFAERFLTDGHFQVSAKTDKGV